jgi:elongator complex protein 3
MSADKPNWHDFRRYTPDRLNTARKVLDEIKAGRVVNDAIRRHPLKDGGYVGKHMLVAVYRQLIQSGEWVEDVHLLARIRMKPIRTLSGVTTVTVLTKPYPCPGECIFCPSDLRMPKSYLPDEPGARRGLDHDFDPFDQVKSRLEALEAVGHPTDKVELLILGGTWSAYRKDYQEWFVLRCFDALNGNETSDLKQAHLKNEKAAHRNVGLVVETRPDSINKAELKWLRSLGVTKIQMGVQSLDDRVLALNRRGHTVSEALLAVDLVRAAGFKIVLHWMPNLLGATLDSDRLDFQNLWVGFCPDEIKIYPTQLLENSELYQYWLRGEYRPYTTQELVSLIADIKPSIPRYCRVNRIIRDIPSTHVVEGNKRTSLRQDVQAELCKRGKTCECIRCREVRQLKVRAADLEMQELVYSTGFSDEHFLSFVTTDDKIVGFLRLSIPTDRAPTIDVSDLAGAAIIREVHVYGQSLAVGTENLGAAQHIGLGSKLIRRAEEIVFEKGLIRVAVISAVGTRRYYQRLGYHLGDLYMIKDLPGKS